MISDIIRQISDESDYDGGERVGYPCDGFAYLVIEQLGKGEARWTSNGVHCYVFFEGKCYDEHTPEGVENEMDLGYFKL